MHACIDWWMDGWMDGCVDVWMYGCMYVFCFVHLMLLIYIMYNIYIYTYITLCVYFHFLRQVRVLLLSAYCSALEHSHKLRKSKATPPWWAPATENCAVAINYFSQWQLKSRLLHTIHKLEVVFKPEEDFSSPSRPVEFTSADCPWAPSDPETSWRSRCSNFCLVSSWNGKWLSGWGALMPMKSSKGGFLTNK